MKDYMKNINFKTILIKRVLPVAVGSFLGYAYYYFIGCNTGTCPITSNPFISTFYGGLLGRIFAWPSKSKKEVSNENN
jgi:uncharacterized membrane protein YjjB (DUF3815 family)